MKIGILSDIHDHLGVLDAVWGSMPRVDEILFCGDLCSPFVIHELARAPGLSGAIHIVFGNNDGDLFRITQNAGRHPDKIKLYGESAELELDGLRIAINHFPGIAISLAASGQYDLVCFGHNHGYEVTPRQVGAGHEVLMINPGTLMGARFDRGGREPVPSTFTIFDTATRQAQGYQVELGATPEVKPVA